MLSVSLHVSVLGLGRILFRISGFWFHFGFSV